ncbi:DUF1868 domain-containing protein [Allorhizobium taibaishanense]|uniref:DUF1868 domain-containing protein n=1 Tax=Allorhizobium taibaishanense TaxID=887144 RepID=A0A1Q9A3S1_9HYPH|nr:DUF1868 domain-containing protein [Allorhizobium taibaishanense]MBB4006273.1 hypothetical protein [Allorhizobium taibaishanense]OLP49245.1 hypothetical protein BJF91_19430 [Allorhizobium taibaishanense]
MSQTALSTDLIAFSAADGAGPSRHIGTRFDDKGHFLPEPGNTVVCHLTEGSDSRAAIVGMQERYRQMPEADHLAITPASSLHMTLFQGIIEHRRSAPFWPHDLPFDVPIDDMTEILAQRLAHFRAGPDFKVTVSTIRPTGLRLVPVTEADRRAMAEWRDRLADLFGYRHPDHETYEFHVTFAYMVRPFSLDALFAWQTMLTQAREEFAARFDHVDLNPPAFCAFEDMKHFEELVVLA